MFEVLVGERLKAFSGVMLLWGDCEADLQNSVIDKAVILEAGADVCLPEPLELEDFVIAASERLRWVEDCVAA
ncbi:MAG: hypothetical protein IIA89_15630 [Chloroflexi bacterium]|nr:hypothetical protein [Chloroflexota bacterium]